MSPGTAATAPSRSGTGPSPRSGTTHEFAARAPSITSGAFVAAARLASPGATLVDTGNAPFVSGRWAFSLNGIVDGFPRGVGDTLRADVEPARHAGIVGDTDTEVLFALVLQALDAGTDPATALADVVHRVVAITTGRLNLLLTDGRDLFATRYGNSLWRLGTMLASEPLDDRPSGRKCRTGRSSPSPPTAAPRDRCERAGHCEKGSTPMTGDVTVDVHLEPEAMARALEADVRAGLGSDTEDAAPEVVLRRPRQRAVRRDHPPARVLPDPHRARHPARARPRHRRAHQGRHARRARLGDLGEDAHPPRRVPRRRHARPVRAVRRERADPARRRRRGRTRVRRRASPRGRRRLRAPPRRPPGRRHTRRRVPRQHHRQPRARTTRAVPRRPRGDARAR